MRIKKTVFHWSVLLIVVLILCGRFISRAAENVENNQLAAISMEIRTDGALGLRILSSIEEDYVKELQNQGKKVEYGTVVLPATVLENVNQELEINKTYTYNGKNYTSLKIAGTNTWEVADGKIYYTGVLTGINNAGFNTRYAARPYITIDGVTTYGNVINGSSYNVAKEMAISSDVEDGIKQTVIEKVIDVCDTAKKTVKDVLTITSNELSGGNYTVESTSSVRNYKKVVIDDSVQSGIINLKDTRIQQLEIAEQANCEINVDGAIIDTITASSTTTRAGGVLGNITLNLKLGNLFQLNVAGNMAVTGSMKVSEVIVTKTVELRLDIPVGSLNVEAEAAGSDITINNSVQNVTLEGKGTTIDGTGSIETVVDNGENSVAETLLPFKIQSVEVQGSNKMIVTLNRSTESALTKEDMAILCHGGTEMTILGVTTEDRQVYTVSTSTFAKDDTYTFSIEVAEGSIIQYDFSYKIDCPTVSDATVLRSETTRAEFDLYDVDEGGYVYVYIPGFTQVASRMAEPQNDEITVDLVKKGYKQEIKTGFNKVVLKGLSEGITYKLYYVLEAYDGRISDVHGPLTINGTVQEDPMLSKEYTIESVEEFPSNTITIKLNKAPEEELTLQNFFFICPADSAITIDKATLNVSEDRKTYTIVIPENYGHMDNQYTAKISFSDGTVAKKTFLVHFNPPNITNRSAVWMDSQNTKVKISFTSDEAGIVYLGLYTWNHTVNQETNTPTADSVIDGSSEYDVYKYRLKSGLNEIEYELDRSEYGLEDVFLVYEDAVGNYTYTDHVEIGKYVEPAPEAPFEIVNVTHSKPWFSALSVEFSDDLNNIVSGYGLDQNNITISAISETASVPSKISMSVDQSGKYLNIQLMGQTLTAGTYKISIVVPSKDGNTYTVEKEFTVE